MARENSAEYGSSWGEPINTIRLSVDLELLDERKQTKLAHVPERFGPHEFLVCVVIITGCDEKSVTEVGNCGNMPKVTGQRASEETNCLIDEMSDDHLRISKGSLGAEDVPAVLGAPEAHRQTPDSG